MNRALAALTGAAFVALLVGLPRSGQPVAAAVLGVVFTALATAGFAWVRSRGRLAAGGYVVGQLALGFALFDAADASTGATLLLIILVIHAVILLPLPLAATVTAVVPLVHLGMTWTDGLREGIGTLVSAAFAAVVTTLLLREQRVRAELAEANARLHEAAAQAEELATTRERNRLARDIHDGLGHHLTVVQKQVEAARAVLPTDRERADALLGKAQLQAEEALAEVRRSVGALREPRPGLSRALAELAAQSCAAGVPTELELTGAVRSLPADAEEALFRAAQEGLTNVRKHAGATAARLVLDFGSGTVCLHVRDDGAGADPQRGGGFGLRGLRERATRLGGRLTVDSTPGHGLSLRMEVPG